MSTGATDGHQCCRHAAQCWAGVLRNATAKQHEGRVALITAGCASVNPVRTSHSRLVIVFVLFAPSAELKGSAAQVNIDWALGAAVSEVAYSVSSLLAQPGPKKR